MKRLAMAAILPLLLAATDPVTEPEHIVAAEHTVQEGETLSDIASRARVPLTVIAAANGLAEPYKVRTGQILQIPRQRIHIVKDGDTGFSIARRYGVPFDNIAIANMLEAPYTITTGQRLIIPAIMKAVVNPDPPRLEPYFRWPHDGQILLGFSLRADGGGHDGLDFSANLGDMVRASASGYVVYADDNTDRFGRLVVIDHGNGWRTRYGHLNRITVKLGEVVKTGERIGTAGDAGNATRPEVHFEIMQHNKRIDPVSKLPQR